MNTEEQNTNVLEEEAATNTEELTEEGAEQTDNAVNEAESGAEAEAEKTSDESTEEEEAPFLVCRYNKNDVPLTMEKAQEFAQKGMHYEDKLNYLAAISDCKTPNELLKNAIDNVTANKKAELEEQFPDDPDTVELYMEKFQRENEKKYGDFLDAIKQEEEKTSQTSVQKLGDEFLELKKEFPELKEIKDIPPSVLKESKNMSLEHAYLKFLHNENKTKQAALEQQKAAEEKTTGSMSSEKNASDSVMDEFIKGIWSK